MFGGLAAAAVAAVAAGGAPSMVSMNSDSRLRSICRIVALRCWIDRPDGVGEGGEDVWASCWRRRLLFRGGGLSVVIAGKKEKW